MAASAFALIAALLLVVPARPPAGGDGPARPEAVRVAG
jgi:hypothetical protein